jgi:uncharacterized protein
VKGLTKLVLIAVSAYLAACAAAWAMQDQLIFHPKSGDGPDPGSRQLEFETVYLSNPDGVVLHGWYLPAPKDAIAPHHVLFLHGNAGRLSQRLHTLHTLHNLGHATLIIDYRGYGLSTGSPSESGLYEDADTAWKHLTAVRGIDPAKIILYGRSLGGAVASELATRQVVGGVILESTFTRLADVATIQYPWLPVTLLLRSHFDTLAKLPHIRAPVLIAHSREDQLVPYELAQALSRKVRNLASFIPLSNSHNRAFRRAGNAYYARLDTFIRHRR